MRFLFQSSEYSIAYNYYAAQKLNEINPNLQFGLIIAKEKISNNKKKFLNSKKKIFQEFYLPNFEKEKNRYKLDEETLNSFFLNFEKESFWKIVASDREIGGAYAHGSVGYDKKTLNFNRQLILEYFSFTIKSYEEIFDKFKPDIFVAAIAMGDISVKIIEIICKKRNIKYFVPESVRLKNYCTFSNSTQLKCEKISNEYIKFSENKNLLISKEAKELYNEITQLDNEDQYFDDNSNSQALSEYLGDNYIVNYFYILIFLLPLKCGYDFYRNLKYYFYNIFNLNYIYRPVSLLKKFKHRYLLGLQKVKLVKKSFYNKIDFREKYIYYPLMSQPEYSSNMLATMWVDQLHLIESLSKSLPYDWFVYVKEHPSTLNDRLRPNNYFSKIKSLPNVKLVNVNVDSKELVLNSDMVCVVSGTTGWQAILNNKPLLEFRNNLWSILGLSTVCTDLDNITEAFFKEINRFNSFDKEEVLKRILTYLEVINKFCFKSKCPEVLFYQRDGSDLENKICGNEIAEYFNKIYEFKES